MKTLLVMLLIGLSYSLASADSCPNLAGEYISDSNGAHLTITETQLARGGVVYSLPEKNFDPSRSTGETLTYAADGKVHVEISADKNFSLHTLVRCINDSVVSQMMTTSGLGSSTQLTELKLVNDKLVMTSSGVALGRETFSKSK